MHPPINELFRDAAIITRLIGIRIPVHVITPFCETEKPRPCRDEVKLAVPP